MGSNQEHNEILDDWLEDLAIDLAETGEISSYQIAEMVLAADGMTDRSQITTWLAADPTFARQCERTATEITNGIMTITDFASELA